jgi:hypothetical protein
MAYAALDYAYTGILAPESKAAPAEGNPLETYLYRRQITAHYYTWHKFLGAWAGGVEQSDYSKLQSWIASKTPVPTANLIR